MAYEVSRYNVSIATLSEVLQTYQEKVTFSKDHDIPSTGQASQRDAF